MKKVDARLSVDQETHLKLSLRCLFALLAIALPLYAQDKPPENKKKEPPAQQKKKTPEKVETAAKPAAAEEPKGALNADTFSGLQFRSIGPSVASGRVIAFAVNPRNKAEYYVGVASGGVSALT